MAPFLSFSILLSILSVASSAETRPHGLGNESPVAFSPSAYTFFHPNAQQPTQHSPCGLPECSSPLLSLAANVQSGQVHESPSGVNKGTAVGGIVGIPLVFVFACLVTAGVYYVVIKRRAKSPRASPLQQEEV